MRHCASAPARSGALLITVRGHHPTRVLGLPGAWARVMRQRARRDLYDEVHEQYGTLKLDLSADPSICARAGGRRPVAPVRARLRPRHLGRPAQVHEIRRTYVAPLMPTSSVDATVDHTAHSKRSRKTSVNAAEPRRVQFAIRRELLPTNCAISRAKQRWI